MKKKRFGLLLSFVGAAALLGQLSIGALPPGPAIDRDSARRPEPSLIR